MIIVRVTDGLGNQFFQFAFAKAYSIKNNCEVLLDISYFKDKRITNDTSLGGQHSLYVLKLYKTKAKLATQEQCLKTMKIVTDQKHYGLKKILHIHRKPLSLSNVINEKKMRVYEPSLLNFKSNAYFKGFMQTEKYFKAYRNEVLKCFELDIPLDELNSKMMAQIKSTNSVSLHIRRGDFLNLDGRILPLSYYKDAIRYITSKEQNLHFYIFSNDMSWVSNNLKIDAPFTIVDINKPNKGYYDLELMRNCKHNIIANSTFSWWGAWLNQNPKKVVICPLRWNMIREITRDINPADWIKIDPR